MEKQKKTCKHCMVNKSIDQYGWTRRKSKSQEYRRNVCKSCINAQDRERSERTGGRKRKEDHREWRIKNPVGNALTSARYRSKKQGRSCTVTLAYLQGLWDNQKGCCAITGIPFEMRLSDEFKNNPLRPALDRIDSKGGYDPGNVRWVCNAVNVGMSDWGKDIFMRVAQAAVEKEHPFDPFDYEFNVDVEQLTKDLAAVVGN